MNTTRNNHHMQQLSNTVSAEYVYIEPIVNSSKLEITDDIFYQIKQNINFNLGEYSDEQKLKDDLERKIFGNDELINLVSLFNYTNKIESIIENALEKSFSLIPIKKNITIYIIPMCNKESSKDLDGVSAFVTEGNIMYLLIDTLNPKWERSLLETIPHEYAHHAYTSNFEWNSILDGFINEGLAEHFRIATVGGFIAPWSNALQKEAALRELQQIPEKETLFLFIDHSNIDYYLTFFFGTKDLPNWYGYSIGYWLIDDILKNNQTTLVELFEKSPQQIYSMWKK